MTQTSSLDRLYADYRVAIAAGQFTADRNGAPVAILARDGWYAVCEEPPDDMDSAPLNHGWTEIALIDPQEIG